MQNKKLRETKRKDKPLVDAIKNEFLRRDPLATKHKVEAAVFRLTY
jgi:hypothetical protein